MPAIVAPLPQFFELDGKPLQGGAVYIGAANLNPETNPLPVFWDAAYTQPAQQPLRTANGVIVRSGTAAQVYVSGNYSALVKTASGQQVLYARTSEEFSAGQQIVSLSSDLASTASGKGDSLIGVKLDAVGAVSRTQNDKNKERVSIADFGGRVTNTASENAAAMQAAVNSLTAGGEVILPNGDWLCGTVFVQNDRVSIRGEGDATWIIPGNVDGLVVGATGVGLSFCEVTGIRFDRATKSTAGAAVKMIDTIYSKVENCKFRNSYIGVHVKAENDSLKIVGNHFYDGTYYGVYEFNQNETWANDLTIRGNFFWHVEQAGVYMSADGVGVASVGDTYIDENVFVSSVSKGVLQSQYAIRVVGAGTYNTNVSVIRNTFEGLRLQALWLTGLNRCRVSENYFSGTDVNDVGLYFGSGIGNSVINGNIFVGYNNPGAFIFNTGGITFTGNSFASNATLGGVNAELVMRNVQDVQIVGNYFYSSSSRYCIDLTQDGGTVDFVTITGNRFSKFSGNTNYVYDIRHNNFGGNRVLRDNLGNDSTSGKGTAPPVAGMALQWYPGEKVENSTASELGTTPNKYVIEGWVNVTAGDPGTWVQRRTLTGN